METIRLTVKRTKPAANTDQSLKVDLPRLEGSLDAIVTVELEAYHVSGSVGSPLPSDIVVTMNALGSSESGYISHVITDGSGVTTHIRTNQNALPIVPPGGLATRDHTTQALVFRSPLATPMNLTNSELTLMAFNATTARYEPWTDWTEARFQLILTGYVRDQMFGRRVRI